MSSQTPHRPDGETISRELADRFGQRLAGAALAIEAGRRLLGSDPKRADRLLASAAEELGDTLDDIRTVSVPRPE